MQASSAEDLPCSSSQQALVLQSIGTIDQHLKEKLIGHAQPRDGWYQLISSQMKAVC